MTQEEKTIIEQKLECVAVLFRSTLKRELPELESTAMITYLPITDSLIISIAKGPGYQMVFYGTAGTTEMGTKINWKDNTEKWNEMSVPNYKENLEAAQSDGFVTGYPPTASEGGESDGQQ